MSVRGNPERENLPLEVLEQIDRVCDRFERARSAGERPRIEDFLDEVEDQYRPALAAELQACELDARRALGEIASARPDDAPTALLLGLLAYQTGLIGRTALTDALRVWTSDKSQSLGDRLAATGAIDDSHHKLLDALVAEHLKLHQGDVTKSLASLPAQRSTLEQLERVGDADINATLGQAGATTAPNDTGQQDASDSATFRLGTASSDGQRYRVLRLHAKGGLGAVFVALDEELHREVALKEIQDPHADDPISRSRFLLEAEITGGLEHPGIVPVYGLGTYGNGRPYYAMRFIRGDSLKEAIDRFHADENLKNDLGRRSLELRKLLRRFLDVCNAIDYAHSRGVLHRDLKPGNVIVGKHGETLLIDWGLAKTLGQTENNHGSEEKPLSPPSASGTAQTLPGSAMGTPAYMSPEQARGQLDRLGPRSDVYSLGATLYCLLTGKPPFEGNDVGGVIRAVQNGEFQHPRQLDSSIDKALESICLKAMATEPERRYASCRALADDVERWMADETVSSWSEPWTRTLVRWLTRHRTGVTAAGAALLAGMIGLAVVAAVQAQANVNLTKAKRATDDALVQTLVEKRAKEDALSESEEARKQAEAVSTFLVEAFRSADPFEDSRTVKVVDVLDRAVQKLEKEFTGTDATRGAMLDALGRTNLGLGLPGKAEQLLEKARSVRESVLGPDHPDTLKTRGALLSVYATSGRNDEGIRLGEETLKRSVARLGPEHPDTLSQRFMLAGTYSTAGRLSEAIELEEETLKLREKVLGREHNDTLESTTGLALLYYQAGRYEDAIRMNEESLKLKDKIWGREHPGTLITRNNLAIAYADAGRLAEAIQLDEDTLQLREKLLGPDHDQTLASRNNLGASYLKLGQVEKALALHELNLRLATSKLGPDHPYTLNCRKSVASAYHSAGREAEAIRMGEETLRLETAKLGNDHPSTLMNRHILALAYLAEGRTREAIALHEGTLKLIQVKLGPTHPNTLTSRSSLASAYLAANRPADALRLEVETVRMKESKVGPDHPATLTSRGNLATAHERLGHWTDAEALRRICVASRRKSTKPDSPPLAADIVTLGNNLLRQRRWLEAETLLREGVAISRQAQPDNWQISYATSLLGEALLGQGKNTEAEPLVTSGYEGMKARASKIPAPRRDELVEAAERVVRLYEAWGKPEQAAAWKTKLGLTDLPADPFAR